MTPFVRIATLLAAALPLAAGPDPVAIRFAPAEGTTWTKTFESSMELEFEAMSVVMDGNEVPTEYLPIFDIQSQDVERLVFTDHYVAVGEGRARVLRRRFDTIEVERDLTFEMSGMAEASSTSHGSGTSGLEDRTVVFTWDDDDAEYEVRWTGGDGDDALLLGLVADVDLRALLPDEAVAIGDSWEVSWDGHGLLLEPGGDLHVELEGENLEAFEHPEDGETMDGSAFLRLVAVEAEEGARIAVIEIEGRFTVSAEGPGDLDDVPVADGDATVATTLAVEFEGELRWDLAAGMLRSLEVTGETELTVVTTKDPGQPGPEFESTMWMTGSFRQSLATELVE
ncbi:MAG: hypothetical protein E2O39_17405 [Planctomycetota bacterium]|nr:MAG: hypothetical protein E2O39_17405 [Planctomycetota bacterium]